MLPNTAVQPPGHFASIICVRSALLTVQFLQNPEDAPGSYGENYPRLKGIKRTFDPTHLFRHSMWPDAEQEVWGKDNLPDGLPEKIDGEGQLGDDSRSQTATATYEQLTGQAKEALGGDSAETITGIASIKEHKTNVPTEVRSGEGGEVSTLKAGAGAA